MNTRSPVASRLRCVLARFERAMLPPLCSFCRQATLPGEAAVCDPCRDDLPCNSPCCPRCAEPLAADPGGVPCGSCQASPPPYARVLAPLRYEFPVDAAVRSLKFRRRLEFVPVLSAAMLECLVDSGLEPDLVVPVPLHFIRHGRRGFNQAELLARPVARTFECPLFTKARRVRATRTQSGLDATGRRRNIAGAFSVAGLPSATHALIVDDVMTTGATVGELARTLRKSGIDEISVLVAARR